MMMKMMIKFKSQRCIKVPFPPPWRGDRIMLLGKKIKRRGKMEDGRKGREWKEKGKGREGKGVGKRKRERDMG